MSEIFLSHSSFGTMYYDQVFLYYDGPKVFSLKNSVGFTYLGYWVGNQNDTESWWVIPVSSKKLRSLVANKVDLRDVLSNQEENFFYRIDIPSSQGEIQFSIETSHSVEQLIILPDSGVFLDLDSKEKIPTHEIKMAKKADASVNMLSLRDISRVQEAFNRMAESLMRWTSASPLIEPVDAREGSFILSFSSEELSRVEPLLRDLSSVLNGNGDIISFVNCNQINPLVVIHLLEEIISSEVVVQLLKIDGEDFIFDVVANELDVIVDKLKRYSSSFIQPSFIPQSNNINRILHLLDIVYSGKKVTVSSFKVSGRQIAYYAHAAKILGLLDENRELTPFGKLLQQSDEEHKISGLLDAFELSECGKAWVSWSGKSSLREVSPYSAIDFLNSCCVELRGTETLERRSSTLRSWLSSFQSHKDGSVT